jgi:hypothetical protein
VVLVVSLVLTPLQTPLLAGSGDCVSSPSSGKLEGVRRIVVFTGLALAVFVGALDETIVRPRKFPRCWAPSD